MTFSNLSFLEQTVVLRFIPSGCLARNNDPARTLIAYSGPKTMTDAIIKQI